VLERRPSLTRRPRARQTGRALVAAAAALSAAVLVASPASAQDRPTNSDQELGIILGRPIDQGTLDAKADAAPLPRRPLMRLFDQVGFADALDNARIDVYGHVEGSYTYNFDDPASGFNVGRVFDFKDQDPTLNQLDLTIERRVAYSAEQFDVGGRIEMLYGGDARFIHANGMFDNYDFFDGPENQFDIPQLYVDVNLPVANGLRVRAGKFLFFKQIDPNASVFYSHSFTFGAALPFTLTGITGYYEFNDKLNLEGGIVRGWDQSLNDNNGSISAIARLRYRASDQLNLSLAAITGPELPDNSGDYRTAINFVASYQVSSAFTLLLDAVYGYQSDAPIEGASDWYGVAVYGIYRINPYVSAAARLEYYRDDEGFTTGIAGADPTLGFSSQDLYEATVGLTITPFAEDEIGRNLKIRPEVRWDYSSEAFFEDFTDHNQFTFAIDAIFNF
jgi:hypothetical protein